MNLTSSQKKAILVILTFFLFSLVYHFIDKSMHPPQHYDFSRFEVKFKARFDSIQNVLNSDSLQAALALKQKRTEDPGAGKIAKIYANKFKDKSLKTLRHIININAATVEELTALPRIGPKIAGRIVKYRIEHGPFVVKKDIINVKGIGQKTYEKIRTLIKVD